MMSISLKLDAMINEMTAQKRKPEHIIMGREYCVRWLAELVRQGDFDMGKTTKYTFKYRNIPVIVCTSEILEVVPNAKFIL
jgi:hypothetical protein